MATLPTPGPPWLQGLNPPQLEAATHLAGPLLVLAGAGTGKTRALTSRLATVLATRAAWPSQILAVTFTNKAAREMRERLRGLIGAAAEDMPWLGTFHAISARMLRRHAECVGLKSNFTILDPDDGERLAKLVIRDAGLDDRRWSPRAFTSVLDRFKNRGLTPDLLDTEDRHMFADGRAGELYARFQAELLRLNACDFGDLLLHLLTIFRSVPDVKAQWQRRFRHIVVDEFQDSNAAQYQWLLALAAPAEGGCAQICCVGDDDQSIYSWRGAEVGNILRFEEDFPGARIVRLEQNYRSTGHILGAAGGVIARNRGRMGKRLWTAGAPGEKVEVISVWDGPEEARQMGERIERLARQGAPLSAIAILVRAQFQTREIEDRFIALGLPYRIVGGFRFYERAEIRDALAYLRVVTSPDDSLAFERIVNTPRRGLGDKSIARLQAFGRTSGLSLFHAAAALVETDELTAAARGNLARLVQSFRRWRDVAPSLNPPALLDLVLDESGYRAMLEADKAVEAAARLENLKELGRAMEEYGDVESFLEHVALVMDNDRDEASEKVTIMTLHGAKGLEFAHVFLPGWEEGLFPSQRALDEGGEAALEEERRLAYVGITRARRSATILHAANRRVYGQWTSSIPSRFVGELPAEHVTHETTMSGGESLWRAAVMNADDPFAHLARATGRGPGWTRASAQPQGPRTIEGRVLASTVGGRPRQDLGVGTRVFHQKFGQGTVVSRDASKLEVAFDHAGTKMVLDSFVEVMA